MIPTMSWRKRHHLLKKPRFDPAEFRMVVMKEVLEEVKQQLSSQEDKLLTVLKEFAAQFKSNTSDRPSASTASTVQSGEAPMASLQLSQSSSSSSSSSGAPSTPALDPKTGQKAQGPSVVVGEAASELASESASSSRSETEGHSEVAKRKASKRRKWIRVVYKTLDRVHLPDTQPQEDEGTWLFNTEKKNAPSLSFPIYKVVSAQLSRVSSNYCQERMRDSGRKHFDPVRIYSRSYKTPKLDHENLNLPHTLLALLIDEVKDPKGLACASPSLDARFAGEVGVKEKGLVQQQLLHQTTFRVSNALSLGLQTLSTIISNTRQAVGQFKSEAPLSHNSTPLTIQEREKNVANFASLVSSSLQSLSQGVNDISRCSADLFSMNAHRYVHLASERRKLWLDHSSLDQSTIKDVNKCPVEVFQVGLENPPNLLGAQSTLHVKDALATREKQSHKVILDLAVRGGRKLHSNSLMPRPLAGRSRIRNKKLRLLPLPSQLTTLSINLLCPR